MNKALVVVCLLVGLSGCTPSAPQEKASAELQSFDSAAALQQYIARNAPTPAPATQPSSGVGNLVNLIRNLVPLTNIPSIPPGDATVYDPTVGSTGGLAETDMQALWSAEMDAVQMRGDYLYVLHNFGLSVVQTAPADQMKVVGRVAMTDLPPASLYLLDGDRAVVVTHEAWYNGGYPLNLAGNQAGFFPLPTDQPHFDVYILDLKDPASPAVLARYSIEGSMVTSRIVGGRLVVLSAGNVSSWFYGLFGNVSNNVSTVSLDDLLPQYSVVVGQGEPSSQPLLTWDAVRRPVNPDGNAILAISTIDLATPGAAPRATGMAGYWETAYATPASLYLTNTAYLPNNYMRTTTEIHRFDLTGPVAAYAGSVRLDGRPLSGGSLSEQDGLLRVATTTNDWSGFSMGGDARLYVLRPTDGGLEVAGKLESFAADDEIYTMEYFGHYAVLAGSDGQDNVSLLVDLSEATHPALVGATTIPSGTEYLQLLDATHLLALASEPQDSSALYAYDSVLRLSILDAANPTQPATTQTSTIGTVRVYAASNRRDVFLSDGLMVLPIDLYEQSASDTPPLQTFGGQYAYHISTDKGFEPLGRIETADPYMTVSWNRAFVKDGVLYAVTNVGVKAAALGNVGQVLSSVRLP